VKVKMLRSLPSLMMTSIFYDYYKWKEEGEMKDKRLGFLDEIQMEYWILILSTSTTLPKKKSVLLFSYNY
jgi:hypothetical protein